MSTCTRCGETLIETAKLAFCPHCLDAFIPSGMIARDIDEEATFGRIRDFLNHTAEPKTVILEREHGTGCTTALTALATHQVLPAALPDFTAFAFDANRPAYRRFADFRAFLRMTVRGYAPQYEEPDTDPTRACTMMLNTLMEQLRRRGAAKRMLLFILLPDEIPADFIRALPRERNLPPQSSLFLVCGRGQAPELLELLPRAKTLPGVFRDDPIHIRAVNELFTKSIFRLGFWKKMTGGNAVIEQARRLTELDYHRIYLMQSLMQSQALSADELEGVTDLWQSAFQFYQTQWGSARFETVAQAAATMSLWHYPIPPMLLPGLCAREPEQLMDVFRMPELVRVTSQEGRVVASIASPEATEALRTFAPDAFRKAAARVRSLALGEECVSFPAGDACWFFANAADAIAAHGTPEEQAQLLSEQAAAQTDALLQALRQSGAISIEEEEEIWNARAFFARTHARPLLQMDACMHRLRLHEEMNLPSAVISDLTELLEGAQPTFQRRAAGRPMLAQLYAQRARWCAKASRIRAALEDYRRAVAFAEPPPDPNPTAADSGGLLAALLAERGAFEQEHRLYELMMDDFDRAMAILQAQPTPDPAVLAPLLLRRGQALVQQGRDAPALDDLNWLSALLAQSPLPNGLHLQCESHRLQGAVFDRQHAFIRAAAAYGRAIELLRAAASDDPALLPDLAAAYGDRAHSHEQSGNTEFAYADRSEAILALTAPEAPSAGSPVPLARAYLNRARVLGEMHRAEEGVADCTAGIRLLEPLIGSSSREVPLLCAELYQQQEALHQAISDVRGAAEDHRRRAQLQILLRER